MVMKAACPVCGGHIEFERPLLGTLVQCPHCGAEVNLDGAALLANQGNFPIRGGAHPRRASWMNVLIAAAVVFGVAAVCLGVYFLSWLGPGRQILGSVVVWVLVVIGFAAAAGIIVYLTIIWIIFPHMVGRLLRAIEYRLRQIQENTRRR